MPNLLRNVLAVLAGLVAGGIVNMGLVVLGPALIPPPAGVDVTDAESLSRSIHLLEPRHFVVPFVAHAAGTFVGALVAFLLAASRRAAIAWGIGVVNLCGGIAASFMIPAPTWFVALDLLGAYLPMAWLAIQIGTRRQSQSRGTPARA